MWYAFKVVAVAVGCVLGFLLLLAGSVFITVVGSAVIVVAAAVILVVFACVAIHEWWTGD